MKQTQQQLRAAAQVTFLTNFGLYVHAPFCKEKCRYCDFYSFSADGAQIDSYVLRVKEEIMRWGVRVVRPIDTLYLGGGTPTLLGGKNIKEIINAADNAFGIKEGAEITLECNPGDDLSQTLFEAYNAGVNRLSIGVQSGCDETLKILGRRHTAADAQKTVAKAREIGFKNISLDLMLGLPGGCEQTVRESIDFVTDLNPEHISIYMLKLEKGTPFYNNPPALPSEDEVAAEYLFACRYLKEKGYSQYEISNFCKEGFHSRHNKNYWLCGEYLGIGPSAHSFLNGKRFYYPRDVRAFLAGCETIADGVGGTSEEYIMLSLRTSEGLSFETAEKFGADTENLKKKAAPLEKAGLLIIDNKGIKLKEEGYLLSNAIIGELI